MKELCNAVSYFEFWDQKYIVNLRQFGLNTSHPFLVTVVIM